MDVPRSVANVSSDTTALQQQSMSNTVKKVRSKTASPTRHGPQQCQVNLTS